MSAAPFNVGDFALWLYEPRGGYGYCIPVPCVVAGGGYARTKIIAQRKGGRIVRRFVKPEHLSTFEGKPLPFMLRPVAELNAETTPASPARAAGGKGKA